MTEELIREFIDDLHAKRTELAGAFEGIVNDMSNTAGHLVVRKGIQTAHSMFEALGFTIGQGILDACAKLMTAEQVEIFIRGIERAINESVHELAKAQRLDWRRRHD